MANQHDLAFKSVFAHPELVRDLISDFTTSNWMEGVGCEAFERVNASFVSDQNAERHSDLVWRVNVGGRWRYVYLLLEFQSGVDRWMASRMQVYIGLLYQHLVKQHDLSPGALLPPVLPIVFYNGRAPWTAPTSLSELVVAAPAELAMFQASQQFFLIDQWRLDPESLAGKHSIVALLFRLELATTASVIGELAAAVIAWLRHPQHASMRRDLSAWFARIHHKRWGLAMLLEAEMSKDVQELPSFYEIFKEEGRKIGRLEGHKEGQAAGKAEGKVEGKAEGKAEGLAEGLAEGRAQGLVLGLRESLKKILRLRFGTIDQLAGRIEQAGQSELELWLERALTAPDLPSAFDNRAQPPAAPSDRLS